MRLPITIKLLIIATSTLVLTAITFMFSTFFILERQIMKDFKSILEIHYKNVKSGYHDGIDITEFLRENERGLFGSMTMFDSNMKIIASTAPMFHKGMKLPPDIEKKIIPYMNNDNFEYIISEQRNPMINQYFITLIGKISPNHFIFIEKSLDTLKFSITFSMKALLITIGLVFVIAIFNGVFYSRIFTHPILKIRKKAYEISNFDFDTILDIKNKDEIGDLAQTINWISDKLKENISEIKSKNILLENEKIELNELNEKLDNISKTDKLTQLANRLHIDQKLNHELYRSKEINRNFSVILLDIDHFKNTNDKYGHMTGDEILKDIAKILQEHSRKIDLAGRWGGEEFIVILPDTNIKGAIIMAEHLRSQIESFKFTKGIQTTASFGVGEFSSVYELKEFLDRVDEALYRAKQNGRNRVEVV